MSSGRRRSSYRRRRSSSPPAKKSRDIFLEIEPKYLLHTNYKVHCLAFSPNGKHVVSSGENTSVYNVLTGEFVVKLKGQESRICAALYTPDGKSIISGCSDRLIQLRNASTGDLEATLEGHTMVINALAISEDGKILYSGSDDYTIREWDLDTKKLLRTLTGHTSFVNSLAIAPGFIISGSSDNKVKCWSRNTGECLRTIEDHVSFVLAVACHTNPDGSFLFASGSRDNRIRLYDDGEKCIRTLELERHKSAVKSLSFRKDGTLLASGHDNMMVMVWDVSSGECLRILQGNHNEVNAVAFSPDGSLLVTGSDEGTVCVWNVSDILLT